MLELLSIGNAALGGSTDKLGEEIGPLAMELAETMPNDWAFYLLTSVYICSCFLDLVFGPKQCRMTGRFICNLTSVIYSNPYNQP